MPWHTANLPAEPPVSPSLLPVQAGGHALVLTSVGGVWYAVEDRCSHAGCAFSEDGEIDGFNLICNCHGSEFDIRDGQPLEPPADEPIATFPVRVEAGMIEVEL